MWETWKNISAIVVLAFLIAANPKVLINIADFVVRIVYNGSVMVVGVVQAGAKKVGETNVEDFKKPIPYQGQKGIDPNAKGFQFSQPPVNKVTGASYRLINHRTPEKSARERYIEAERQRLFNQVKKRTEGSI